MHTIIIYCLYIACSANSDCGVNAECDGAGQCVCSTGYEGNPYLLCENIDECAYDSLNNCDAAAVCTDNDGGYDCDCLTGYEGSGINGDCYLECPVGTEQIASLNADIGGCGLEGCNARYQDSYTTIEDCLTGCSQRTDCESFTWAPLGGDRNHVGNTVCTLYNSDEPNQVWSPAQIMCRPLRCPDGYEQVGGINADIGGCGLEGCNARYQGNYNSQEACERGCNARSDCLSYTWAPLGGDRNHVSNTVCTLYNGFVPNQVWSPNQIMCKKLGMLNNIDITMSSHTISKYVYTLNRCM